MIEKYKKLKKFNNSFFHSSFYVLILMAIEFLRKSWNYALILAFIYIICIITYFLSRSKLKEISASFKMFCPKCHNNMTYKEEEQYMISKTKVDKATFDITMVSNTDRNILKIKKYYCLECKICYSIIEIYGYKNNGDLYLSKKTENLDTDYENNY